MNIDAVALDCETYDSALKSICKIFGIRKKALLDFLQDKTLEVEYNKAVFHDNDLDWCYFDAFVERFQVDISLLKKVYWFHIARTLDDTSYEAGILPLGMIKDKLFSQIYQLVSDKVTPEEWNAIIKSTNFCSRMGNDALHGCYAVLVKEEAFPFEGKRAHDYLAIPEIVEDLCSSVKEAFGIDLQAIYKKVSQSIIVKFFTYPDIDDTKHILKSVVSYLRSKCLGEAISDQYYGFDAQTMIDTPNHIVPREYIVSRGQVLVK